MKTSKQNFRIRGGVILAFLGLTMGFTPLSGQTTGAYQFDGQDDFIETFADPPHHQFNEGGYTIEVIFKKFSDKPSHTLVSQLETQSGLPVTIGINEQAQPYVEEGGNIYTASEIQIANEECYHLSVVFSTAEIKYYLNGTLQYTANRTAQLPELDRLNSFYFGVRAPGQPATSFDGIMDEVRIFADQRTAAEIYDYQFSPLPLNSGDRFAYFDFEDFLDNKKTTDPFYFPDNSAYLGGLDTVASRKPSPVANRCMDEPMETESIGPSHCPSVGPCNTNGVATAELLCNGNFEQYCTALNNPPSWAIAPHAFNEVGSQGTPGSDVVNWEQVPVSFSQASPTTLINSTPDFYVRGGIGTNGSGFSLNFAICNGCGLKDPPSNTWDKNGNAVMAIRSINKPGQHYIEAVESSLKNGQALQPDKQYVFSGWFYKANKGRASEMPAGRNNDPGHIEVSFTDPNSQNSYNAGTITVSPWNNVTGNNHWEYDSIKFTTPPTLPSGLSRIRLTNTTTSSIERTYIYMDDLSLINNSNLTQSNSKFPQYVRTNGHNDFFNRVVRTDANDNVYAALTMHNIPIGGQISIPSDATFSASNAAMASLVVKYNSQGDYLWHKLIPNVAITDFDFASNDNVFLVGYTDAAGLKGTEPQQCGGHPFSNSYYTGSHINWKEGENTQLQSTNTKTCNMTSYYLYPVITDRYNEQLYLTLLDKSNGNYVLDNSGNTISNAYGGRGEEKAMGVRVINNKAYISCEIKHSNQLIDEANGYTVTPQLAKDGDFEWELNGPRIGQNNDDNVLLSFDLNQLEEDGVLSGYTPGRTKLMAKHASSNKLFFVDDDLNVHGFDVSTGNITGTRSLNTAFLANDLHVVENSSGNPELYLCLEKPNNNHKLLLCEDNSSFKIKSQYAPDDAPLAVASNSNGVYTFYKEDEPLTGSPDPVLRVDELDLNSSFGTAKWSKQFSGSLAHHCALSSLNWVERFSADAYNNSNKVAFIGNFKILSNHWKLIFDDKKLSSLSTGGWAHNHSYIATVTDNGSSAQFKKGASDSQKSADQVSFYPNPIHAQLTITSPWKIKHIFVRNLNGQLLKEYSGASQKQLSINLTGLPEGMYIITVKNGNKQHNEKVAITRE